MARGRDKRFDDRCEVGRSADEDLDPVEGAIEGVADADVGRSVEPGEIVGWGTDDRRSDARLQLELPGERRGCGVHRLDHRGSVKDGSAACATIERMTDRPLKVLIAKPGLDGHDRGAKVLARGLRDEGFEVVYTGLRQTPEMIATAALQEDVDVVGLSILSGAHMTLVPRVTRLLARARAWTTSSSRSAGSSRTTTSPALKEAGVAEIFGPGTTIAEVAEFLRANARSARLDGCATA